jgi:hypothetical protein
MKSSNVPVKVVAATAVVRTPTVFRMPSVAVKTNATAAVKTNATAAKTPSSASPYFDVLSRRNGRDITSGVSIVVTFENINGCVYIFVHADAVGRMGGRMGLAMSSGGTIESGHDALYTANKENMEEEKCLDITDRYRYHGSTGGKFHYFVAECNVADYSGRVTTPGEIMSDSNYIPKRFSNAIATFVPTTWGVPLNDLLNGSNKSNVYSMFRNALFALRNDGVFN